MTEEVKVQPTEETIERGSYEILKDRLENQSEEIRTKAEVLNERRVELFGGTALEVVGSARIRTANNCVPRDIVQVGRTLLFGYNVFVGLRKEIKVADVFAAFDFSRDEEGVQLQEVDLGEAHFLSDPAFVEDFRELYRYYKEAQLLKLRNQEGKLLALFKVGQSLEDVKVFRWEISAEGRVTYIDNRGERDYQLPPSHGFEWTRAGRKDFVKGQHPHVSIYDEVFVEMVGGDLTVKVENNTEDGLGIYREPVEDADQSLDDGEILYARAGSLILLKMRPFREDQWRHFVFDPRLQKVHRIDAIGEACIELPEDHGILFPGGYVLQTGETKIFDPEAERLRFIRLIRSPNGEDVLYVFHRRLEGQYVLLSYNLIRKELANPIDCHGFSLFADGTLVISRALSEEPTRIHPMQVWQTPFQTQEYSATKDLSSDYLGKIGNAELVRGISDAFSLTRLVRDQEPSRAIYESMVGSAGRMMDQFHWLDRPEVEDLRSSVEGLLRAAELIIDEFEKVETLKGEARKGLQEAEQAFEALAASFKTEKRTEIDEFVQGIADLRRQQGRAITLREVRYLDLEALGDLETRIVECSAGLEQELVQFLLGKDSLAPYRERVEELEKRNEAASKVIEVEAVSQDVEDLGERLDLLAELISGLAVEDATERTAILEGISEILGLLNRLRALVLNRRKDLLSTEGVAEFGAQFKVFSQGVAGAVALADHPDKCDAQLSRLMVQLEELESRFSEFDEFQEQMAVKREEIYEAFSAKKQQLLDERQQRADNTVKAARRILEGVVRRGSSFVSLDELNSFFASDPMIGKLRQLIEKLRQLEDNVRADELASGLKQSREEAAHVLRDRQDLFEEGASIIRLGENRFSVNTQEMVLTMVPREGGLAFHLTGTDFYETVDDSSFEETKIFWDQTLVSEAAHVYRAEYLAYSLLAEAEREQGGVAVQDLKTMAIAGELSGWVTEAATQRYDEGYERGVHDHDATLILTPLVNLYAQAGLLRFAPRPRALALIFWAHLEENGVKKRWERRSRSLIRLRRQYGFSPSIQKLAEEMAAAIHTFYAEADFGVSEEQAEAAGSYLLEEVGTDGASFTVSAEALSLHESFLQTLNSRGEFLGDLKRLEGNLPEQYQLCRAWLEAYLQDADPTVARLAPERDGVIALLLVGETVAVESSSASGEFTVEGLLGQHSRIKNGRLELRLDEFLNRLDRFSTRHVPGFRAYQKTRHGLLRHEKDLLRIDEFKPKVMSSFVRNQLIDQVYLPIIGQNLARQIGTVGTDRRTDRSGLLLLISPPGYGKTTLMEYIAQRLGLVFMKVNGPSLGHGVTSLDPAEAPNATSRQEVEKINLAFEMGNNVLLYLDDIQHTNPELLQKFISLCDAQRRVEGVWKGRTQTYDLRGKRFAVCMAGNPYTESGERFRIPDMLANRADIYNLGDVLEGKEKAFSLSYLENALTSNKVLAPLTTRDPDDVYALFDMAQGKEVAPDRLKHPYSAVELEEVLAVLAKLFSLQEVVLRVNQQYIASAAQQDAYRTEPPFQLQGSYRNMNRLASQVVAAMNEKELDALITDHYQGEAQTLTSGTEQNLLKLGELRGRQTEESAARWEAVKKEFRRQKRIGGAGEDAAGRVVGQLSLLSDQLEGIGSVIEAGQSPKDRTSLAESLVPVLEKLQESTAKAPLEVKSDTQAAKAVVGELRRVTKGLQAIGGVLAQSGAETAQSIPVASGAADLAPYLEQLTQVMAQIGSGGGASSSTHVVQTLPGGVLRIIEKMIATVDKSLMTTLRSIDRRMERAEVVPDKNFRAAMNKTLKGFDQLKDLLDALRTIDTTRILEDSDD